MSLDLVEKQEIVDGVHAVASTATSTVVADYRGMTVDELTDIRRQARERGVQLQVIRNSLARRALLGTEHDCVGEILNGPTLLGFSIEDPGAGARLFRDFVRHCPALEVRGISVGGELFAGEDIHRVASLPTREEALSKLMSVITAPVAKLTQTLHAVPTKLLRTLVALKDKRDSE